MNIFDFLIGGRSLTSGGMRYGITPVGTDTAVESESTTVLYTCVKILADNFSRVGCMVKDASGNQLEHRISDMWNFNFGSYINPQTGRSTAEWDRNTAGNAFFEIKGNSMHYIPAAEMFDYYIQGGQLYYKRMGMTSTRHRDTPRTGTIPAKDILHFRGVSNDGVWGLSPLSAAYGTHQLMSNAVTTVSNFYKNNAMTTHAIETDVSRGGDYKSIIADRELFKKQYAGTANAGETVRLSLGEKMVPLAVKFADAELINTMEFSRDSLSSLYQIPNFMLSSNDSSQSVEEQTSAFVSTTLAAIANVYKHELEFKLLTVKERKAGVYVDFDLDSIVEVTFGDKVIALGLAVDKGLLTPNEASKKLGASKTEGKFGDVHYSQAQYIPREYFDKYSPLLKEAPVADKQINQNDREVSN
jgi:HK97 family phage portal protein